MIRRPLLRFALLLPTIAAACGVETIAIDGALDRHPIDPLIYGVAWASADELAALNATSNRWGGNTASRYNWKQNADNKGADWYYESVSRAGAEPSGEADAFVQTTNRSGAQALMTVPILGWVAKLGPGRSKLASYSVLKYGAQDGRDAQWMPDAGNGRRAGARIADNDPNDANMAVDAGFQREWVAHLVARFGKAGAGGVPFYLLDNEATIWHATHADVHPAGAGMDELWSAMSAHAQAIKAVDPGAQVLGPEEWGIAGLLLSGKDQAGPRWLGEPGSDKAEHGGQDYAAWLLERFRAHDAQHGQRLLDVFTVHCYPNGKEYSNDTSEAVQQLRNRSTRCLWDPEYVDENWLGKKTWPGLRIQMIPRLKRWVAECYPGTRIGITEYNWGAEGHINGATALADVWGIFGREGLDLASYWTKPKTGSPAFKAMQMYRNYDGAKSAFGDTSVRAAVVDPDRLAAFAALRSGDGALTVMLINKVPVAQDCALTLARVEHGGAAQVWQLTAANAIARVADAAVVEGRIPITVPGQSITLLVIPAKR